MKLRALQFACLAIGTFVASGLCGVAEEEDAAAQRAKVRLYFSGMKLFKTQCLPCHGERGRGDGPWADGLGPKPRDFSSGIFKFRTTPYGMMPAKDDLRRTIRSGVSGTAMPTFQKLSDGEIDSLIAYIQGFSRRWNDKELMAEPLKFPATPSWFSNPVKLAEHAKAGKAKFSVTCASCHGVEGKGDGAAAKGLVDVWKNPIVPADLSDEHHKSGDSPADLYRTIATGLDGTPMLGFAGAMKESEIWDLVAYIKSIEKPLSESNSSP